MSSLTKWREFVWLEGPPSGDATDGIASGYVYYISWVRKPLALGIEAWPWGHAPGSDSIAITRTGDHSEQAVHLAQYGVGYSVVAHAFP